MKTKTLLTSGFFLILFILFTFYAPVVAKHHIEYYHLGEGGSFSIFCGLLFIGTLLIVLIIVPVVKEMEEE